MKRFVFAVMAVLLAMVILSVNCAPRATPPAAPTPAPAAPTQNVTGTLVDVNVPAEPGKDVVTIETPQGRQTFPVTENTTFSLEGRACPIGEVGQALDAGNASYNCTVIVDDEGVAVSVYVAANK